MLVSSRKMNHRKSSMVTLQLSLLITLLIGLVCKIDVLILILHHEADSVIDKQNGLPPFGTATHLTPTKCK
jgi:hypothetical protein